MDGVELILLNDRSLNSKSSLTVKLANFIQKISSNLYIKLSAFRLNRICDKIETLLQDLSLDFEPDVIHILRTQPEGIASLKFIKKYNCRKLLTTWGQDFVLWADNSVSMKKLTNSLLSEIDIVYPDNHRDERIIKEEYNRSEIKSYVMPATGGLQLEKLDRYDEIPPLEFQSSITFFTNRGYSSSFVKLKVLLRAFKIIVERYPGSHFYIDLMSRVILERDNTIKDWISDFGLIDHVTILHLSRDQTFRYLRSCDYYISATTSDGLPLSLLETLYFGTVPIVYNHESTLKLMLEFNRIYGYDTHHPEIIANKVIEAVDDDSASRELIIKENRKVIKEKYTQSNNLKITLSHYIDNE